MSYINAATARNIFRFFATICLFLVMVLNANAALLGQQVTGVLNFAGGPTNFFDPATGGGTPGSLNNANTTVTIADPAVEFGYDDIANIDMANFTDNGLTITDNVLLSAADWTMSFTSAAFVGLTLLELNDNFVNGGVLGSILGNTLTFSWVGTQHGGFTGLQTAEYSLTAVQVVPLPAALPLFGTGLAVLGLAGWRKKRRRAAFA